MDQLIESIYRAAYSPELWPQIMQDVATLVDAASATLLHREMTPTDGPVIDGQFGSTPAQIESYAKYFRTVDHRFREVQKLPVGGVLADDHNFDFHTFAKSEIYQDFWIPARRGRGMAGLLFKDATRASVVSVRRYIDHEPFTHRDVDSFQQLLPHLRRSLQFRGQLLKANVRADALAVALDQFPIAVFLLDQRCNVLDHNRAALELLADLQAPICVREQRLSAIHPRNQRELQEAVRAGAESLHKLNALPCFLRFEMRDGIRVLVLMPVPITRSVLDTRGDLVLLFCRETTSSYLDPKKLERRFGFTPAEARLAAALAEGATLEQFAVKRGISVGTARTQLKSAMDKADVHTQAQLVGTILRSLAAVIRPR